MEVHSLGCCDRLAAMAPDCGPKSSQVILAMLSLLLWICGCVLLGLGVWVFLDPAKSLLFHLVALDGLAPAVFHLAYILLVLGGSVMGVSLLGCCGSLHDNRCLLAIYMLVLTTLLCSELGVAMAALLSRTYFLSGLQTRLLLQLEARYGNNTDHATFSEAIDLAQYRLACCGVIGPVDYKNSNWRNESAATSQPRNVPLSCCLQALPEESSSGSPISVVSRVFSGTVEQPWQHPVVKDEAACQDILSDVGRYTQGCSEQLESWFWDETSILATVAICVAVIQVLGMVFSLCLHYNTRLNVVI